MNFKLIMYSIKAKFHIKCFYHSGFKCVHFNKPCPVSRISHWYVWAAGAMHHEIPIVTWFICLLFVAQALYTIIKDGYLELPFTYLL